MKIRKSYDLNTLLNAGNILVCIIAIIVYNNYGRNDYVNINSIYLLLSLGVLNFFMLWHEKNNRDPFIIILVYINLFFYLIRIITLLIIPWSLAFLRYPFNYNDLNFSLLFILSANSTIFFGLWLPGKLTKFRETKHEYQLLSNPNLLLIFMTSLVFANSFGLGGVGFFTRITQVLGGVFLNIFILIFLTIIYLIINYGTLNSIHKIILFFIIFFYVLSISLIGSRSGILTVMQFAMFGILAFKSKITLSFKLIWAGIALGIVAIFLFFMSTYIRLVGYDTKTVISSERLKAAKNFNLSGTSDIEILIRPLTDRLGFLDYASDLITNGKHYLKVINPEYYFKSFIDNGITPGFNVFGTPKASQALRYIYTGISNSPKHSDIMDEYNSDQFTMYGEYFILFGGYKALIFIFLSAFLFKLVYIRIKSKDVFTFYTIRAVILLIFCNWLNSFGIDWMIIELISIIFTVFLFRIILFREKEILKSQIL